MFALAVALHLVAQELDAHAELPLGWQRTREIVLSDAQVGGFAKQLGVALSGVVNEHYDVGGSDLQVNRVTARDEAGALALVEKLGANGRERFVARRGNEVVEFAKMNVLAASALRNGLGFEDEAAVEWRATFEIVCVARGDDMEGNEVFNLCLGRDERATQEEVDARIAQLTSDWTFGTTLRLAAPTEGHALEYTFEPQPLSRKREGDTLVLEFPELPRAHGLPIVRVVATTTVAPWYAPREGAPLAADVATAATIAWPSEHETVRTLVARLVTDEMSPREKLHAIFGHVAREVRYGGNDVMGSRHGTLQVLAQGFGRCWDKSDVLVTLLRAAGLPAREVAGWLLSAPSGHVWVEVYLEGEGWLAVDATCTWLGTSRDYVPWLRTDDGHMPIVYVSMPTFEQL